MTTKFKINYHRDSSDLDLSRLLDSLGVQDYAIITKSQIPKCKATNLIINLDDRGSGTHWVAMCRSKKRYFDSYGQDPPKEVPQGYKHRTTIIEGIEQEDCGQLCALWLYYINFKSENSFYKLFKPLYT